MGKANISVTRLIGPPRIAQLEKRHADEITVDAADSIWALLGSSVHYILEKGADKKTFSEERLYGKINDYIISGAIDWFNEEEIQDYKTTSVWSIVYGAGDDSWQKQLNCYNWLLAQNGFKNIKRLRVCAILKDWMVSKAKYDQEYPQYPAKMVDVKLWPLSETEHYIRNRVMIHSHAETQADDDIPVCEPEERWLKPTKYALMKTGRKSALKLCDTMEEAQSIFKDKGATHIDTREGENTRCLSYCRCNKLCTFYKTLNKDK